MSFISEVLYPILAKKDKERFNASEQAVLMHPRHVERRQRQGYDVQSDLISFIPDIVLYAICAALMYLILSKAEEKQVPLVLVCIMLLIALLGFGALFAMYYFDLKAVECYFLGYKKSSYYLATKTKLKDIRKDKGLAGEFKAYVLSRSLKVPHKILYNVCVPMDNGNFQEVDSIIITRRMLYVLECKNMAGTFQGTYDDEKWIQIIGSQQHEKKNVYLQNQGHTMALDKFLLDRGIIQNGQNVCINMVLASGTIEFPAKNVPMDFRFGSVSQLARFINSYDESFCKDIPDNGIMDDVYEALLPYALYTDTERKMMMQERDARAQNGEFRKGQFHTIAIQGGIPGITPAGKNALLRYNKLYTQIQISDGKSTCWQTRTDIPNEYLQ